MLRAKQMGLSIAELDEMEEGLVMDMVIESGNDACSDEYCQVADQHMYDTFWQDRSIYGMINSLKSFVIKIFDRKIRKANQSCCSYI